MERTAKRDELKGKELIDTIEPKIKKTLLYLLTYEAVITKEIKELSDKEWEELVKIAKRHHVQEYLYYNLKARDLLFLVPETLQQQMDTSFKRRTFQNMALMGELNRIAKALESHNIPVIALKGPHLMTEIYPHIALRYSRDLDILVPKNMGKKSFEILQQLNYTCEKNLTEDDYQFTYYYHFPEIFHKNTRQILELHGHITHKIPIDIDNLWQNTTTSPHSFYLFNIETLILHLSIHMTYADLFKNDLRHYLDLYIILKEYKTKVNWEKVMEKAEHYNCLDGVVIMFQIISELFNIKLPATFKKYNIINNKKIIEYALTFLWLYDKSSPDYEFFRSHSLIIEDNSNLFTKIFKKIFIPPRELAYRYGEKKLSNKLYFLYIRRLFDLFKNHSKDLLQSKNDSDKQNFQRKTQEVYQYFYKKKSS